MAQDRRGANGWGGVALGGEVLPGTYVCATGSSHTPFRKLRLYNGTARHGNVILFNVQNLHLRQLRQSRHLQLLR